jgi:hypothetical protein
MRTLHARRRPKVRDVHRERACADYNRGWQLHHRERSVLRQRGFLLTIQK